MRLARTLPRWIIERPTAPASKPPRPPKPPAVGIASTGGDEPSPGTLASIRQELRNACLGYERARPGTEEAEGYLGQIKQLRQYLREAKDSLQKYK